MLTGSPMLSQGSNELFYPVIPVFVDLNVKASELSHTPYVLSSHPQMVSGCSQRNVGDNDPGFAIFMLQDFVFLVPSKIIIVMFWHDD